MFDEQLNLQQNTSLDLPHFNFSNKSADIKPYLSEIGMGNGICWLAAFSMIRSGILERELDDSLLAMISLVDKYCPTEVLRLNQLLEEESRVPFLSEGEPFFVDLESGELNHTWLYPRHIQRTIAFLNKLMKEEKIGLNIDYVYLQSLFIGEINESSVGNKLLDYFESLGRQKVGAILNCTISFPDDSFSGHSVAIAGVRRNSNGERCLVVHDMNLPKELLIPYYALGIFFNSYINYLDDLLIGYNPNLPTLILSKS